jgi:hypothetical protein
MTVKELIERLQTLDPDLYVFTSGYEGGYEDVVTVGSVMEIALNVHEEWYYGKHESVENIGTHLEHKIVKGIIL